MKKPATKTYGLHLMLDGYGANPKRLADVSFLYKLLCDLPEEMGMRRVGFPHIVKITEEDIAGLSGFVFIMESHISIHTYSNKGFLSMDAYSCKKFDYKKIIHLVKGAYRVLTMETFVVKRGTQFPVENIPKLPIRVLESIP